MAPNDNNCHENGAKRDETGHRRAVILENDHNIAVNDNGIEYSARDRAEGNVFCDSYNKNENEKQDSEGDGSEHKSHSCRNKHALAALEAVVDGEDMTEHRKKTCDVAPAVEIAYASPVIEAEKEARDRNGKHGFQHISKQGETRGTLTKGTKHIGESAVAASVLTDIVAIYHLGDEDSGIDATEKVRANNAHKNEADLNEIRLPKLCENA